MQGDIRLFNRQFIFCTEKIADLLWPTWQILGRWLHVHPNTQVSYVKNDSAELYLIGYLFDYMQTTASNEEILISLNKLHSFQELIRMLDAYSGQFVLIYATSKELYILNDACAQREVYYDESYSVFGSQPKLLEKVIKGESHTDPAAVSFYQSEGFLRSKAFVGDTTHYRNIHHLKPNHFISISEKSVMRFFPTRPIESLSTKQSAELAVLMLKGFLSAAAHRYQLRMGVTAGYDSRILFLASLHLNCRYQVSKINEKDNSIDIAIAQKLAHAHGRTIGIGYSARETTSEEKILLDQSIDFPTYRPLHDSPLDGLLINGNCSEIARNYYGNVRNVTVDDLLFFYKHRGDPFVKRVFKSWLDDSRYCFKQSGYDVLDMFYWEERMGNWAARSKTHSAMTGEVYSPFCSRKLLCTMLATPRKDRDRHENRLYLEMMRIMSPVALKIPINPARGNKMVRYLKRTGLFALMKFLSRQYRRVTG